MKRLVRLALMALFLGGMLYSGIHLGTIYLEEQNNQKIMKQAQKVYRESAQKQTKTSEKTAATTGGQTRQSVVSFSEARANFNSLRQLNSDISGWLTIGDTTIDYPVLQTTTNDYYLTHDYLKEKYVAGSIFKDYRNTNEFDDFNTILYGHSMRNGTMFGELTKYLVKDFAQKHATISYDSLAVSYEVKIFAVYQTTTINNYIQTDFPTAASKTAYLKKALQLSQEDFGVKPTSQNRILTLSTCDESVGGTQGRLVVQGILIQK